MAVNLTRAAMCVFHWWLAIQLAEVKDLGHVHEDSIFLKLTDKVESEVVGVCKWEHSKNN